MNKYEINGGIYYLPQLEFKYLNETYHTGDYFYLIVNRNECPHLLNKQVNVYISNYNAFLEKYENWFNKIMEYKHNLVKANKLTNAAVGGFIDDQKRIIDKFTQILYKAETGILYFDWLRYIEKKGLDSFDKWPKWIELEVDTILKSVR